MKPTEIQVGKNYRVTRRYSTGAVLTFEGRVDALGPDGIRHDVGEEVLWIQVNDSTPRLIEIERLPDTYPTRPGTLLRHPGTARTYVRIGSQWLETEFGDRSSPPNDCVVVA